MQSKKAVFCMVREGLQASCCMVREAEEEVKRRRIAGIVLYGACRQKEN